MTTTETNANVGLRLRELRIERGLQQADVARQLGVSAAYMNLIEKGKRAVQLPLLWKALELFGMPIEQFTASLGETRVEDSLAKLLDEPLLKSLYITNEDLAQLSAEPKAASTIAALFNMYKSTRTQLDRLLVELHQAERDAAGEGDVAAHLRSEGQARAEGEGSSDSDGAAMRFDYSPFDEVVEFLQASDNWFAPLEEQAEELRRCEGWGRRLVSEQLSAALTERFGVRVETAKETPAKANAGSSENAGSVIRRYDGERGVLTVSPLLLEQRLKFQLAHTIGLRILDESPELLRQLTSKRPPRDDAGAKLYKIHLANYFAGALLLPYDDFFREVQRTRYDVERLADLFDVSYETVAHRCTNLADPRRRGLPMHFLRSDIGGNISKRYTATGIRFPNGTGSCPRWAVHMAFLTPSVLTRQYSIFPDGSTYFCFAKVIVHAHEGSVMKGTAYSIGLGTHADEAKHLAYAADMPVSSPRDLERMAVPTGVSCRFCERTDCAQRAAPSHKFAFSVDPYTKKDNVFSPLLSARLRRA
jgi:predicted transcriptional regulator/transcriptional regulator with XRE-family HTH domain